MKLSERANSGLHGHVMGKLVALEPRLDATIMDVGCGTGALLTRLRELGYISLLGLDISPPLGLAGIRFIDVDLDDCRTEVDSQSVDIALAVEVIEHVENIGSLLNEIRRVLVPGGKVILTTPNIHSLEARIRFLTHGNLKQFDRLGDPTHVYPIFQYPFRLILERHGFLVAECWGFPLDGSSPTSRRSLQLLAKIARCLGLKGLPAGDQICMVLQLAGNDSLAGSAKVLTKREQVTAHYRNSDIPHSFPQ